MNLKKILLAPAVAAIAATAGAQSLPPQPTAEQIDSLSRAVAAYVGPSIGEVLTNLGRLDADVNVETFLQAFGAIIRGEQPAMSPQEADAYISAYVDGRRMQIPDTLSVVSQEEFLAKVGKEPGAQTLPSGLVFITEKEGQGACPADTSTVEVLYTGRFANGVVFDETEEPVSMTVGDLVAGFSEGLKLMKPGGRYRLVMPSRLAYGPAGVRGAIPGNAALDFTVDLIAIKE